MHIYIYLRICLRARCRIRTQCTYACMGICRLIEPQAFGTSTNLVPNKSFNYEFKLLASAIRYTTNTTILAEPSRLVIYNHGDFANHFHQNALILYYNNYYIDQSEPFSEYSLEAYRCHVDATLIHLTVRRNLTLGW